MLMPLSDAPQPVTTAITARSTIPSNTAPRRLCVEIPSRKKQAIKAPASLTKNQFGPCGRFDGRNTPATAAVEAQVIVAFPVVAPAFRVMVFGAVKFTVAGAPKVQVGGSSAPIIEVVTAEVKVMASAAGRFAGSDTVMRHGPED